MPRPPQLTYYHHASTMPLSVGHFRSPSSSYMREFLFDLTKQTKRKSTSSSTSVGTEVSPFIAALVYMDSSSSNFSNISARSCGFKGRQVSRRFAKRDPGSTNH